VRARDLPNGRTGSRVRLALITGPILLVERALQSRTACCRSGPDACRRCGHSRPSRSGALAPLRYACHRVGRRRILSPLVMTNAIFAVQYRPVPSVPLAVRAPDPPPGHSPVSSTASAMRFGPATIGGAPKSLRGMDPPVHLLARQTPSPRDGGCRDHCVPQLAVCPGKRGR
jgi:hypothetical protein